MFRKNHATLKKDITILLAVIISLGVSLASCAVRTEVSRVSIEDVKANHFYKNIVFRNFTALPNVKLPDGALAECMSAAIDYLKSTNIFKNIEKESGKFFDEPTMYVDVTLTDLRIVSGAARFWAGELAGRSHMKIVVKLTDSAGLVVAEQELFGAPNASGSAWSFGGTDRGLPRQMGKLLGDFVLANVSKK